MGSEKPIALANHDLRRPTIWPIIDRFLIVDRDSKFTDKFGRIMADAGVVHTAYEAPNMNAVAER